ncbi:chemotaxis protein CheW [Geomonas sp. Red69]|uniref:Chemotaxis protein CheW n=1 Tax=Geomonas diazotrophica TaxID=2843197 RepID=A0ABX8JMH9_9BACT|nr:MULTISPECIES: chemotaxis protein CheW [Geomonas]MBU5637290.1 chemotaxis protein CheW [Geomonas diazotrophica]QWV99578.1 chemotaxis protein CheW [Geomonas nitrogeniifigens]QXE88752.1 chemotaxis protein CheW [Geomonas nitrogeniifigens]
MGNDNGYDIRTILSQMREEYWQALAEEESEAKETLECLVFTLGGKRYAFETHYACEVIRVPKLVRVPAVQSLIRGIFNLRGEITAAIDIRPMLGLPQPEIGATGRILVVRGDNFATGILAEAAHGVQGLCFESFEPAATGLPGTRAQFVRGHFNLEDGSVVLLDMEALLADPELVAGEA